MQKISLNGLQNALSRKELKNVTGGSGGDYPSCYATGCSDGNGGTFDLPPGLCGTGCPSVCEKQLSEMWPYNEMGCTWHCSW